MPLHQALPPSRFVVREIRRETNAVFTLKDERVPGQNYFGTYLVVTARDGSRRIIRPKADIQAGAHYGSRFFGLRAVRGTRSYLVGIEFGLNDVNEYHLILVEPKGTKYLYKATERGALTLFGKGSDLFLHHRIDPDDWGAPGTIPYWKYDPIRKELVRGNPYRVR